MSPLDEDSIARLADVNCVYCAVPIAGHRVVYMCRPYLEAVQERVREKERADILEFLANEYEREERRAKDLLMHGSKEASAWAEERARAYVWAADAIRAKEHLT